MFGTSWMVLLLIALLLDHFDSQRKPWSAEILGIYNGFLSLKKNILSIVPFPDMLKC